MEAKKPGFCDAHGYPVPEFKENAAMKWGLAFEDAICLLASKHAGMGIRNREMAFSAPSMDYVTCHVDGIYGAPSAPVALHEGKTTNVFTFRNSWGEPGTDRIPGYYQAQVQHQMICTGINKCFVSVLVFPRMQAELDELQSDPMAKGLPLRWATVLDEMGYFHQYTIVADRQIQTGMLEAYRDFWEVNIARETPPDPQNYSDIRKLIIEPKGTVVADEQVERWAGEYRDIGGEVKNMSARKNELKVLMCEYMRAHAKHDIDDDSVEKIILRDMAGNKLHQFSEKGFR
jgi:hypothetical protein